MKGPWEELGFSSFRRRRCWLEEHSLCCCHRVSQRPPLLTGWGSEENGREWVGWWRESGSERRDLNIVICLKMEGEWKRRRGCKKRNSQFYCSSFFQFRFQIFKFFDFSCFMIFHYGAKPRNNTTRKVDSLHTIIVFISIFSSQTSNSVTWQPKISRAVSNFVRLKWEVREILNFSRNEKNKNWFGFAPNILDLESAVK